jgi:hypothetical protein
MLQYISHTTWVQEIKEQDNTISEKEKRIYDLKKKNQELEKFKFVLDHKIKELKKQIEPKEEEIADMKEQIKVLAFSRGKQLELDHGSIHLCTSKLPHMLTVGSQSQIITNLDQFTGTCTVPCLHKSCAVPTTGVCMGVHITAMLQTTCPGSWSTKADRSWRMLPPR